MKESAVLLLVPSHHVPEKENTKRKVSEKYNSFNIVHNDSTYCCCVRNSTHLSVSGDYRFGLQSSWRLDSIFYGCTVQCGSGTVFFSAMCADVVVLNNGQNSKTVWERQRQSEMKGKVKIQQEWKLTFYPKKVPVKWAWLFSLHFSLTEKKDDDDTFNINKLYASKSVFVVEPLLLKLLYHRQTLLLVSHTHLTAYLLQTIRYLLSNCSKLPAFCF